LDDKIERAKQEREFREGLDTIGKALVGAAHAADIQADVRHLRCEPQWEPGKSIPLHVRMTLAVPGAPLMAIDLSREQVEDSWRTLERPELRQMMREVTSRYRRMKLG
jgi:hypothetical protein